MASACLAPLPQRPFAEDAGRRGADVDLGRGEGLGQGVDGPRPSLGQGVDRRLRDRQHVAAAAERRGAIQGGSDGRRAQAGELPRRLRPRCLALSGFQLMKLLLDPGWKRVLPRDQGAKLLGDQGGADQRDQERHQAEQAENGGPIGVRRGDNLPVAQRLGQRPRGVGDGRFPVGDGIRPRVAGFGSLGHLDGAHAARAEYGLARVDGPQQAATLRTHHPAHAKCLDARDAADTLQCTAGGRSRPAPGGVETAEAATIAPAPGNRRHAGGGVLILAAAGVGMVGRQPPVQPFPEHAAEEGRIADEVAGGLVAGLLAKPPQPFVTELPQPLRGPRTLPTQ